MEDNVRRMPPRRPQRPATSGGGALRRWRGRILAIVIPLILVGGAVLRFWVDLLWFQELGQRDVLVTRLQWGTALGLAFGLFTFALLFTNFIVARRNARNDLYVPFLAGPVDPEAPDQPIVPQFVLKPILLGVAVIGGIIAGLVMSSRWETVLRFLGRSDFGVTDPHFGKDASFYVFTMPLLELIARSLQVVLVLSAIAVGIVYVATGVIRYLPGPRIARSAIIHLSVLAAAFLLVSAFQFRLSIWGLATSATGYVAGAGWTDTHARIPGYWLMLVASIVLAGLIVWFARRENWRVVGGSIIGWVALSIVVTGIIPSAVQKVLVDPNENAREKKVIEGNIANTRSAFNLDEITSKDFTDKATLTEAQLLEDNRGTTDNIRLWSPDELNKVTNQLQALRPYYKFSDVDVDRYQVGDAYRQVMVSVRELEQSAPIVNQGWTNQHLVYTHGYGAVAAWPNETERQGRPKFILKDLPPAPVDQEDIKIDRPEVYFGENPDNAVIVATKQREVSARAVTPATGATEEDAKVEETRTTYSGDGGIKVDSFARRVAFATTLGDTKYLFTDQLTDKSRVMFRRNIKERVTELAPFLTIDADPYAVVTEGRIVWVLDAYTTSDRYPYSESIGSGGTLSGMNYARNSVKAVVDAYDGDVTLYVADDKDPILGSWRDIFPKLFTDMDKMPEDLRAHLRYPEELFEQQTQYWTRYHMADVADFYAREDQWEVPELGGSPMESFYILAKLPGETKEEFLLVRPLSPLGKKNMVAYMVARSDGTQYGELLTLELPTQTLTQGPAQVQASIKQDSEVSDQVRQWTTGNNTVIFGDLLVLPIEESLLYVQPVYLQNAEAEIPEFQRLVVVLGDTVAWGEDFEDAVRELLAKRGGEILDEADDADTGDGDAPADDGAGDTPAPTAGDFAGLSQQELLKRLTDVDAAYARALACQKQGDWACYGREIESVERLLAAPQRN
ncbi:MAG: hypothetical protein JWM25_659 [Thermoleophilia bacterium]|nr:hypothetical protein [Thermoleophilia bacterium]MCZ4496076.1 hypothetical protein [Thermoleophilia bacterium]